jgi:hypothetical protein
MSKHNHWKAYNMKSIGNVINENVDKKKFLDGNCTMFESNTDNKQKWGKVWIRLRAHTANTGLLKIKCCKSNCLPTAYVIHGSSLVPLKFCSPLFKRRSLTPLSHIRSARNKTGQNLTHPITGYSARDTYVVENCLDRESGNNIQGSGAVWGVGLVRSYTGSRARIPFGAWMFVLGLTVLRCPVYIKALWQADHSCRESYRLSNID